MCITFSTPTIDKKKAMDMSVYVIDDDISIIIPYPKIQASGFSALVAPFQTKANAFRYENYYHK